MGKYDNYMSGCGGTRGGLPGRAGTDHKGRLDCDAPPKGMRKRTKEIIQRILRLKGF